MEVTVLQAARYGGLQPTLNNMPRRNLRIYRASNSPVPFAAFLDRLIELADAEFDRHIAGALVRPFQFCQRLDKVLMTILVDQHSMPYRQRAALQTQLHRVPAHQRSTCRQQAIDMVSQRMKCTPLVDPIVHKRLSIPGKKNADCDALRMIRRWLLISGSDCRRPTWRLERGWRRGRLAEGSESRTHPERLPPPTGFEARPHHRVRLPSMNDGFGVFLLRPIEE